MGLDRFLGGGGLMARIAEAVIQRIKQETSLARLVESQGYDLKKHGKDYVCRCPSFLSCLSPQGR